MRDVHGIDGVDHGPSVLIGDQMVPVLVVSVLVPALDRHAGGVRMHCGRLDPPAGPESSRYCGEQLNGIGLVQLSERPGQHVRVEKGRVVDGLEIQLHGLAGETAGDVLQSRAVGAHHHGHDHRLDGISRSHLAL